MAVCESLPPSCEFVQILEVDPVPIAKEEITRFNHIYTTHIPLSAGIEAVLSVPSTPKDLGFASALIFNKLRQYEVNQRSVTGSSQKDRGF